VNGFSGADGGTRELGQDLIAGKMTANEVTGNRLVFRNRREESNLFGIERSKNIEIQFAFLQIRVLFMLLLFG
jgi:hypothetical protein